MANTAGHWHALIWLLPVTLRPLIVSTPTIQVPPSATLGELGIENDDAEVVIENMVNAAKLTSLR